jgi:hypothetical protein
MTEWTALSEPLQLELAAAAMNKASESLAVYAEMLAEEIGAGLITDRGGAEALRLFAAMVREVNAPAFGVAGHA